MSNAPPKKHNDSRGRMPPTHLERPAAEDAAGRLFRVRDKDWEKLWGQNLCYQDAEKLKNAVIGALKSRSARIEDMEIPCPDGFTAPELEPLGLAMFPQMASYSASFDTNGFEAPAPEPAATVETQTINGVAYTSVVVEKRNGKQITTGINPSGKKVVIAIAVDRGQRPAAAQQPTRPKPTAPRPAQIQQRDPQLAALQTGAHAAATAAARAAQARADDLKKADDLRAKAAEIDKMLEGGDALSEDQIQGILDDVGALPTDEEIAEAHANGTGELVEDGADSDAPVV